jgi:hypothetical protein
MQPPVGWWKKDKSAKNSDPKDQTTTPSIVKENLTHEPFALKGRRGVEVRKKCSICKKKTKLGCQSCDVFICFGSCWRAYHNQ